MPSPSIGARLPLANLVGGVCLAWMLLVATSAGAEKAALIISRTADPYAAAVQGMQRTRLLEFETFNLEGDLAKGRDLVGGLVSGHDSLVITVGSEATLAAKSARPAIPWVYTMVIDPLPDERRAAGVVIRIRVSEQFSRLQKLFPARKRVGVLYNPRYSNRDVDEARRQAPAHDLVLLSLAIEKPEEISTALAKLNPNTVDLLWMVPDRTLLAPATVQQLIQHAQRENLPLVGLSEYHVKLGALAAFSVDFDDIGVQTAQLARRVAEEGLRGQVEYARKIVIYVNPKVQKQLGLEDLSVFPEVVFVP